MTRPRSELVSLETTPYYHCIARCVRQAFLMGKNHNGRSLEHRKIWLVDRIKHLAEIFAIDIPAYAFMSNHYHLVLHIDKARAESWSEAEVRRRWRKLHRGPDILQRWLNGEPLPAHEQDELARLTSLWRDRLSNLSWFMSRLNFTIALRANEEDDRTGHFWEGRFKSQALKDDTALLACMAYVDLNPVRAGLSDTLEGSDFTSIQARIRRAGRHHGSMDNTPRLMPFKDNPRHVKKFAKLPFQFRDYLALVNWHGRIKRPGKRGVLIEKEPVLLRKFSLNAWQWGLLSAEIKKEASTLLHGLQKIASIEKRMGRVRAAA